jgi:hypothetical protein
VELVEESQGVTAAGVPTVEEIGCVGGEKTAAAVCTTLALGQGFGPGVAKHRILANPQLHTHEMLDVECLPRPRA